MSTLSSPARPEAPAPRAPRLLPTAAAFTLTVGALVALAALHLTQGTSEVDAGDLLALVSGSADPGVWHVLEGARLPRLAGAVLVGIALGASGVLLQSVARNPLASPDTLAVNAGAYLAVTAVAAFGITLPFVSGLGVAFVGALLTAGLVLALSAGGGESATTRLILAGSATAMAANSLVSLLILLFQEETTGLFAWGSGSLSLAGFHSMAQAAPLVVLAVAAAMLWAPRLDLLRLGDDTASSLGVHVRRTRTVAVLCSLLLAACAVTIAGPIGFVGLAAPVIARQIARRFPALLAHRVLIPFSALCGALVIVGADLAVRAILGADKSIEIPVGVTTTLLGAGVMVWLARTVTSAGSEDRPAILHGAANRSRLAFLLILGGLAAASLGALFAGMLSGDTMLLGGDLVNWVAGKTGASYTWIIEQRYPRVLAAILAGAALACAGAVTQGILRNPLAEPGLLGVTAGAGIGAVTLITWAPSSGAWAITGVAAVGGLGAFALVYALAWRGGLDTSRLVLVGIGVWSIGMAAITLIILASDPWNTPKAMTWLSGTTYGRTADRLIPLLAALVVVLPLIIAHRKEIDLLALDDDTPRTLGVRLERTRMLLLGAAAVLTAAAVAVVGVIGFVGLVAPHLARGLVGSRHARVLPVSILLGILLVSLADTLGRTVIAPAQIPAGLVCSLIGTPYFIWLLWRTRTRSA
ncbi:iron complex transport system permease protein [Glycomyces artemisiae]|uniref:Iron complex transport system permease protein n=1 Tax=Glycomyces artemisiae TaxID=1076443 RepID=A0A2T0UJC4_9ACTN|nr:iron ABC transporter permease [Glycomyces artemisiae]PRY57937.1 iron complex transport system permease protein [Glycomyces artemisiae]